MFERFTDRSRLVVVLAQEESRMLNSNYIGTEHILLGILHEDKSVAAKALATLGLTLETARKAVVEIIGEGEQPPRGHIPFTPRAKKVLELSLRVALEIGDQYIAPQHILLGLLKEDGVAAGILTEHVPGGLEAIRQEVMRQMAVTPHSRDALSTTEQRVLTANQPDEVLVGVALRPMTAKRFVGSADKAIAEISSPSVKAVLRAVLAETKRSLREAGS